MKTLIGSKRFSKGLRVVAVAALVLGITWSAGLAFADGGPDHQVQQSPLAEFGVMGGSQDAWFVDPYDGLTSCWIGTLGCLVTDGDNDYILGNLHVFAADINWPMAYEEIMHTVSTECNPIAIHVGDLYAFVPIAFDDDGVIDENTPKNEVDAAIAVVTGNVVSDGKIMDIRQINADPVDPAPGLRVKKSGARTGLTSGRIEAIHVAVDVTYPGVGVAFFVDQFIVGSNFSGPGDSGSLIVADKHSPSSDMRDTRISNQDVSVDDDISVRQVVKSARESRPSLIVTDKSSPRPVGLLFAGSEDGFFTIANPIIPVLDAFGVSVVGNAGTGPSGGPDGPPGGDPGIVRAVAARDSNEGELMGVPGVVGTGIGITERGTGAVIQVYVEEITAGVRQSIPGSLDGVPVNVVETGKFVAY